MNTTIKTLATVAALGADCSVSNRFIYITGLPPMLYPGLKPTSIIAPVTEVLQETTGTPTAANSTDYAISLVYTNKHTGDIESRIISYTSDASATPTEICDGVRNQINNLSDVIPITATGTTTLILTAVTGNNPSQAQFSVTNVGVGVIAFVTGTAAVIGVGKGLFLKQGNYYDENLVDASYYYQAYMKFANSDVTGSAQNSSNLVDINVLYVLSTATNVETLVGTYGTLTQALAGYAATYVAGTGTLAADDSDDLLTLATGTFPGQDIMPQDVLFQNGESTYYVVESVITVATALSNVAADNAAAAYTIIHRTKI